MANKLDIKRVLKAVDNKNYNFYSNLTDEERKELSPFVLMRFVSNVQGQDQDIEEWFVEMTNDFVNKNHWQLSKNHKELLWKLLAATGAGMPAQFPRLGGQHADYVVAQLKAFSVGERANDNAKVMRMIAAKMSEADMAAVADYLQGLH